MRIRLLTAVLATSLVLLWPNVAGAASQTLYSWGQYEKSDSPLPVTGISGAITNLYGMNSAGYALTSTHQVWAWGNNKHGELGDGTMTSSKTVAMPVKFPKRVVIQSLAPEGPNGTEIAIDNLGNGVGATTKPTNSALPRPAST
jgi:Regulator of chromosome condensation (RCC1) repeat